MRIGSNLRTGGELWSLSTGGGYNWFSTDGGPLKFNATSVANGVVYTTDMTGFLVAREAATGLVLNRISLGGPSWGGVSIAGGTVFASVGTQSGAGYIAQSTGWPAFFVISALVALPSFALLVWLQARVSLWLVNHPWSDFQ